MGAFLAILALAIVGGLFVLQFLTISRNEGVVEVTVVVEKNATSMHNGTLRVRDATALSALEAAGAAAAFDVETQPYPGTGTYVVRIGTWRADGAEGWLYCVGRSPCVHPPLAADRYALKEGDLLQWHWGGPQDGVT